MTSNTFKVLKSLTKDTYGDKKSDKKNKKKNDCNCKGDCCGR